MNTDRNLIFGLLALQMDFVTREQLLEALHAWKPRQATPLEQILREHGMLSERRASLLEGLVEEHVAQHGGDPRAGMKALHVEQSLLEELHRLAGSDVRDSALTLPHSPAAVSETATLPPAAAQSSIDSSPVVSNGVRFRRLREHARGGLGEVFVALDEELNREVALKEIQERFADLDDARTRFVREAEITGKLEHPGVVPVYGLGTYSDGRPFYAMRFIHGQSMEEAIARFHKADENPRRDPGERSLALRELLGRFVAVCNAVAYAHSRGVIHRDLKPANAMLGEYGETLVVDWGLARLLDKPEHEQPAAERPITARNGTNATEMGQVVGTPSYMPPEQASGRRDQVGTASDVFALGATLYCLLTGQAPYSGVDALIQAAMAEYVPARQRKRSVPAALEAVCGKAMAAEPKDRYDTARDLAEEVQRFLADEPVQAYREPLADRARRWGRRNRSVVSAGVVLLVAGVVSLSIGLWAVGIEQERTKAALGRALTAEEEAKANLVQAQSAEEKAKASARTAAEQKEKAEKAEAATLADYRASTDDAIGELIGSKPVLGAQEKTYLEKTLKRWQVFAARTGDDERSQVIRAEGQYRVAHLRAKLGQSKEAVAGFREALAVYQRLADKFPDVPTYCQDLARTHNNLGLRLAAQNQVEKAAEQYHKALRILQKLTDEFPAMPEYRDSQAAVHNNLGNLLKNQKQLPKAAEQYHKALAIQQKLNDDFPDVPVYRQNLATTHNCLGNLLRNQNQWEKAAEQYHKALTIQQKLADESPAVTAYRQNLASTHNSLGNLLADQNQWEKVAEQYHKALAIQQKLADDFPAVTAYQVDLGGSFCNYGHLLLRGGKPADSLPWYDKAIRTLTRVHQQDPRIVTPRRFLRNSHWNRAQSYDQLEKHAEAVKDWNRVIELTPQQEQHWFRAHRAGSRVRAGQVAEAVADVVELTRVGNPPAAAWYDFACIYAVASVKAADKKQEYADRAMELLHKAVKAGYKDAAHLAKDKDLDVLRGREDFKELLASLAKPKE